MGPISCPETSVRIYHHSLRDTPEERSCHISRESAFNLSITERHHFENQWHQTSEKHSYGYVGDWWSKC